MESGRLIRRLNGRSPRFWLPPGSILLVVALLGASCGGGAAPELEAAVEVAVPEQAEASLGFSVDDDSWKFRNYRADAETAFSVSDAIALFGDDAVCVEASGGCTPTPAAAEWIAMVAHSMSFGSCEGMTVTSLDRFLVGAEPSSGQLPFSPDLARQVSRLFATQYLQEVIDATDDWRAESVATIVAELEAALADTSHEQYTLGVYTKGGGHSVLPYAVDRLEEGRAVIHVYDPNWPSQDRYIEVDTNSNIWRFSYSGKDPATDPEAWTGGSKKMDLQPLSAREAPHQEPFAGAGAGNRVLLAVTSTDRNWSLTAGDTITEGAEVIPGEDAVVAVIRAGLDGATTALIEVAAEDSDDIKFEAAGEATVTAQTPAGTTTVSARKQVKVQIRASEGALEVAVSKDADAVVSVATESERIFVESSDRLDTGVQVTEVETVVDFVDDAGEVVEEVVIEAGEDRVDIEVVVEETIVEVVDEQGEIVETVVIEAEAEVSEPETFDEEVREEELVIAATAPTTTEPPATTTSTAATVPAAITAVTVTAVGDQSVTATFTVPDNGGSAITGYVIEYSTDGGSTWTVDEDVFTLTFSGSTGIYSATELTNGTTYSVRVSATNAVGTSSVSNVVTATPTTVPGAPTGLAATAPAAPDVSLSWFAPIETGGSAITDYAIEYSNDSGSTWTTFADGTSTTLTAIVTGLGKGINYTFRVSAVNAAGTGTASSTVQIAIPTTVPGAPTNLTASATSGVDYSIDLAWTAPSDDGGSSLTDYIIEWQFVGGDWWTVGPSDLTRDSMTGTSVTVRNLYSGGYVHVFRVTAINAVDNDGGDPSSTATGTPTGL